MLMAVFPLLSGKSLCMKYDLSNNNLIIKSRTMLRLQPVTPADKEALSYIEDLYVKSFPVDERRPFEKLVELLGNTPVFHLRLLCDGDKKVGFISYWQWPDLTYGEHFAVDPMRGGAVMEGKLYGFCARSYKLPGRSRSRVAI